jgi:hypothetical protein
MKEEGRQFVLLGPGPVGDRDCCIRSNFWKFHLIRTGFTLGEPVSLVKAFRLFKLEQMFFGVESPDAVGWCTTSYLLTGPACLWCCILFCSYEIHCTEMLQIVFLVSLESSWWGGVNGLGSMTFGLVVQKFLTIERFLHWKLNWIGAENFRGIGMWLWCCWKGLDEQDLMEFIW